MDLEGKNILVIGMARSGISAAILCKNKKANVIVQDNKSKEQLVEAIQTFEQFHIPYIIGETPNQQLIEQQDLIILSPGVPTDLDFLQEARKQGIPIWSEIELAFRYCKGKIIGITGTNGKTTTTSLVGHIVRQFQDHTYVVGNIGIPFSECVLEIQEQDIVIVELSSFQLESIDLFKPVISAVLNITPDHLNRHKTFENYISAKKNIFINQKAEDYCIANWDDEVCQKIYQDIPSKVIFFSRMETLNQGIYLDENLILFASDRGIKEICSIHDLKILGAHNLENAMAAAAICIALEIPIANIFQGLSSFTAVEHRIEYVDAIDGVKYYNDSKATNPEAAIKGIEAMEWPIILIGGGMDKGSDFTEWIRFFKNKVKALVVIGETADSIIHTANGNGFNHCHKADSLEEAVKAARNIASKGECVLLSPACASWDMFESYEQRGNLFKRYVENLKG